MSEKNISRRKFTSDFAVAGLAAATFPGIAKKPENTSINAGLKISLNAFSFNQPLMDGKMNIDDLLDYCSEKGFDAVDITGYYFPGYPNVPPDDFIYNVKKKAFRLGLAISGTGVRNDFTWADRGKREGEKKLVKDWIILSEKLGAPLVRIFAGHLSTEKYDWKERAKWISDDVRECAEFGKKHGVMTALQNHNDFLKTSADVLEMMKMVDSEWNGLLLDIGSYHTPDPYKEIAITAPLAISWQLKEKVFVNDIQVDTDYTKIIDIIRKCGYKGYLPLETLGEGDPVPKIDVLLKKVRGVMNS
jgi:sugar phosphate isomerase/epimerase